MPVPIQDLSVAEVEAELVDYLAKPGFVRPTRSTIDASRPWKHGPPNYDTADLAYFRGKTRAHAVGTLESVVENAVKAWEMEATHLRFADWATVEHGRYTVSANGGQRFVGAAGAERGNYNVLMAGVADKSLYDAERETFDSSHAMFREAFPGGFPWEVLETFSGPPRIAFSWRHWAHFDGAFRGRQGDGKRYDLTGFGIIDVSDELKIREIQIFYKPEEFIRALHGDVPPEALGDGKALVGSSCPIASMMAKKQ